MQSVWLILYGNAADQETAKHLLEGLHQIKRIDEMRTPSELRLVLRDPIKESSLIPLLRQSGIHGFRLIASINYKLSRNGSPLSL